jgi:NitT/TauT family transport system ATP-binding protein
VTATGAGPAEVAGAAAPARGDGGGGATAALSFRGCGYVYRGANGPVEAVRDVTLAVAPGEFVSLIGPSGCGKSTLLRLAADVLRPTSGSVHVLGGAPDAARRARRFSVAFQDPVLLPWRTVLENVALPLEIAGRPAAERRAAARRTIELVGLGGFEGARPAQLSGGMRQRAAIARALTIEPSLLLMDEPFGAVDELTRDRLNGELLDVWQRTGAAVLFVTHSIEEAVYLSDRVVVLTRRPGTVHASVTIGLPRPRRLEIKRTREAFEWSARLRLALDEASR